MGDFWKGENLMIVTNLSSSFNPYGLVYYLYRKCHQKADLDKNTRNKLQNYAKKQFIKIYSKEKFLKEFGKNYIEK